MGERARAVWEFNYQIVVTTDRKIDEVLAQANNFMVAHAAFEAALTERSWSTIELHEKNRVVKVARTGAYDSETRQVTVLKRLS